MTRHAPQLVAFRPDQVEQVVTVLADHVGVYLGGYRQSTMVRRIAFRMCVAGLSEPDAYLERLRVDPGEARRLLDAVMVSVTRFFRDGPVFEALERIVVPELVERVGRRRTLRVWVAGCATGEEAWSLAMLLSAACAEHPRVTDFRIVATDLERGALRVAREARYPASALSEVPHHLAGRYLHAEGGCVRIVDDLRARVQFAEHDLAGARLAPPEAVLASFDLISLRNVLIYFGPDLQRQVMERMAAVLPVGGALVLGTSETVPKSVVASFEPYPGVNPRLNVRVRRAA